MKLYWVCQVCWKYGEYETEGYGEVAAENALLSGAHSKGSPMCKAPLDAIHVQLHPVSPELRGSLDRLST